MADNPGASSKNPHFPLPVIQPSAAQRQWRSRVRSLTLSLYRLGVVAAIVWIIHHHHARLRVDEDAPIQVTEVQPLLPGAAKLKVDESDRMGLFVLDASGRRIGYVLRTAPISNGITGYVGPTDTLIALDNDMRVIGVKIRGSEDTKEHVRDIVSDEYFLKTWTGKSWDEVAGMDPKAAGIEGVSGASLTSLCIANGIQHRFQHLNKLAASAPRFQFGRADVGIVLVLVGAVLFAFTHLRSRTWLRRGFQVILIGYLGLWNGRLIAQSLLAGWAESGIPWRLAPGLVLLTGAALLFPWTTRRALYCSHICPHGAAQEWMGRLSRWRLPLPHGLDAGLRWLGPMLLVGVIFIAIVHVPFNLAAIEPFDAYLIKTASRATIAIAVGGLLASFFVPMAYCKYGCPTGTLLSFVRSHGRADHFGRRDFAAGLIVLMTIALYLRYDAIHWWIFR